MYADDIVMIAENEEEMRSMIEKLEGYLDRKKLELNTDKTKILSFRKGGRTRKRVWRWKGKVRSKRRCRSTNTWDTRCKKTGGRKRM